MIESKTVFSVLSVIGKGVHNPEWKCSTKRGDQWDMSSQVMLIDGKVDLGNLFTPNLRPITIVPAEMEDDLMAYLNSIDIDGYPIDSLTRIAFAWLAKHWVYPTQDDIINHKNNYNYEQQKRN